MDLFPVENERIPNCLIVDSKFLKVSAGRNEDRVLHCFKTFLKKEKEKKKVCQPLSWDCPEAQFWRRVRKTFAASRVPVILVASIRTTRSLPKAVLLSKLSDRGRRALLREVTKNPMVTARPPEFLCEEREKLPVGQASLLQSTNQACLEEWRTLLISVRSKGTRWRCSTTATGLRPISL